MANHGTHGTPSLRMDWGNATLEGALRAIASGHPPLAPHHVPADRDAHSGPAVTFGRSDVSDFNLAWSEITGALRWTGTNSSGRFPLTGPAYPDTAAALSHATARLLGGPAFPGTFPGWTLDYMGRARGILADVMGRARAGAGETLPVHVVSRLMAASEALGRIVGRHTR